MIESIALQNYGSHQSIHWTSLGKINLVIGANGRGKSFLLKAIYTAMKTIEECGRGQNNKSAAEILADKLYWTFQVRTLGDLVRKGAEGALSYQMTLDGKEFSYGFGSSTTKAISGVVNQHGPRESSTLFIPEKEVLSLCGIIRKSREQDSVFGFDDTYLDLVRAVSIPLREAPLQEKFAQGRQRLHELIGGTVEYDPVQNAWTYLQGRRKTKIAIGATAEGVKKIAILDQLLGNHFLDGNSVVILDEPEAGLHPAAISALMDILLLLAEAGVQIFIASHSYFVLKKAYLLAQKKDLSIPILSLEGDAPQDLRYDDLREGLPENAIMQESIRLYEEEIDEVL